MTKYLTSVIILIFISYVSYGQNELPSGDHKLVKSNRYEDIKSSPYLFSEFVEAELIDLATRKPVKALVNYNGFTAELEFKKDNDIYQLDKANFVRIEMKNGPLSDGYQDRYMSDSTVFVRGIHPTDFNGLYISLLLGDDINIIKSFEADLIEKKVDDIGRSSIEKYFYPKFFYFKVQNADIQQIKFNKKGIEKAFDSKEVSAYIKKNKLKLNNEDELMEVIRYYQSLQ